MSPSDPDARLTQVRLIHAEVEKRLDSYDRRVAAMDSRAGALVASAGIAGTLISGSHSNGWISAAVAAAGIAAILGVVALLPRRSRGTSPQHLRDELYVQSEGEALLYVADAGIGVLAANEPRLARRARIVRIGFAAFATAVVLAFLSTTPIAIVWLSK